MWIAKHHIHPEHIKETKETVLANKTTKTLVWYAFYDLQPEDGVDPILTAPKPTWGLTMARI